jgi:hypothetical protein
VLGPCGNAEATPAKSNAAVDRKCILVYGSGQMDVELDTINDKADIGNDIKESGMRYLYPQKIWGS